ncbi:MAG: alpha/beta hydrolase [Actinobacteria bacterium]|nr:alpha/beta hydrolase [Actinomycetota bacterium]
MRASLPTEEGVVDRDGVEIAYEVYENDGPTVFLLPTWSIFHSRIWKMQVPYLARHFRVVVADGRGTGHSGRPAGPAGYTVSQFAEDAFAVMDATKTAASVFVSLSCGALWALEIGDRAPHRVAGSVFIGPAVPLAPQLDERRVQRCDEIISDPQEWEKYNVAYWHREHLGFLGFVVAKMFTEPHSTKPIEDSISWGLDTSPQVLTDSDRALDTVTRLGVGRQAKRARYPILVIQGDHDAVRNPAQAASFAELSRGDLLKLQGSGHAPNVRDPVQVNLAIKEFVDRLAARKTVLA